MKWVQTILVIIILIGFPALSWYYLTQGADWRRAGLDAISDKVALDYEDSNVVFSDGETVTLEVDGGLFVIASNLPCDDATNLAILNGLADQFSERNDLYFFYFDKPRPELAREWLSIDCDSSDCRSLERQFFPDIANAALVDDSLYIRRTYDLREEAEVKSLVEHAAILFPLEEREQIELKRGVSK